MKKQHLILILTAFLLATLPSCRKSAEYKALIITGQSQHNWKTSSQAVKQILDETGLFSSKIMISPAKGEDMSGFSPDFSKYDLVVMDYEGDAWTEEAHNSLIDYLNNGGGVVIYNSKSFPGAKAPENVSVSKRHEFEIRTAISDHPVTKGLPVRWLHPDDEIVQGIELAGENLQVLATAFSDTSFSGSGRREPVLVARNYGQGRIFATLIGLPDEKDNKALHCAGSIVTLQRGAEWAATGDVTQTVPGDFPTAAAVVLRPDFKGMTLDEAFELIAGYDIQKSTRHYTFIQNEIRRAGGDTEKLLDIEKRMVRVLTGSEATEESKKLMLRELSWMGSDYCISAVRDLAAVPGLQDEVKYTLDRLNPE